MLLCWRVESGEWEVNEYIYGTNFVSDSFAVPAAILGLSLFSFLSFFPLKKRSSNLDHFVLQLAGEYLT